MINNARVPDVEVFKDIQRSSREIDGVAGRGSGTRSRIEHCKFDIERRGCSTALVVHAVSEVAHEKRRGGPPKQKLFSDRDRPATKREGARGTGGITDE